MANLDLLSIVWGETSALAPQPPADIARLQAVVTKLAILAQKKGLDDFLRRQSAPSANDKAALAAYQAMEETVAAAEGGAWQSATPLPARAVLWEVTDSGSPRQTISLPETAKWILENGVASGGDYTAEKGGSKRIYRLFESAKSSADNELPYISEHSESGVRAVRPVRRWYKSPNWWIGLGGAALFFLAALNLLWTATTFGLAYDVLTGRQATVPDALVNAIPLPACQAGAADTKLCATPAEVVDPKANEQTRKTAENARKAKRETLISTQGPTCVDHLSKWASDEKSARETKGPPRPSQANDGFCLTVSNYAVTYAAQQSWLNWIFGWLIPTNGTQTVSLGTPTAIMMLGVLMVLVGLGRGITGTPLGALISPNGRYSLALAQVTFWTVLVLTSVMAIAIFNGGLVSEMLRYFAYVQKDATLPVAYAEGIFPKIPDGIWAVLGITFGSTAISALLKSLKGYEPASADVQKDQVQETGGIGHLKPRVAGYDPSHRASVADWFLGEDNDNKDKIDISRVQMVLITAGLLVTYGNAIFASMRTLAQYEIIAAVTSVDVLIGTLPPVGTTMAIMLAVSHATYLVAKGADAVGTTTPPKK